jgi:dienelactone hydrolase
MSSPARRSALIGLVLASAWLPGNSAAAERIAVEDFVRGEDMRSPSLSPSGTRLVYITHANYEPVVAVGDLGARSVNLILKGLINGFLVSHCWFKTDDRIVCHFTGTAFILGEPFPVTRLVSLDADGRNSKVLVQNSGAGVSQFQGQILHRLPDDPDNVLIQIDHDRNIFPSVFRLNIRDGRMQQIVRERDPIRSWSSDRDGAVRFGRGYDFTSNKGVYLARDSGDRNWRVLERFARFNAQPWHPAGFGVMPGTLFILADHNGRDALFEMDLSDRSDQQLVYSHATHDVDGFVYWPTDGRIIGVTYETERPQIELFDTQARDIQQAIDAALPSQINRILGASRKGERLLISSYSDVQVPRYYIFEPAAGTLREIGQDNAKLRDKALARMEPVKVPAANGAPMPSYLTLPVGSAGKNLPAVVLPHGGPYSRDSWGYDPLVQFLANRGYAVLQMNYRGSTGFGSEWLNAGHQGWGTVMHDDITAGARWLIREKIADPSRMCIVGWSYGGYAALIGAVKEPSLYRCAVSIAGVSDLQQLRFQEGRFYGGSAAARQSIGSEDLAAQSPRRRAAEIKVPVLLVHGTSDVAVKVEHTREMDKALSREKKAHQTFIIENGDHSLSLPAMRLTLFSELGRFLDQHLGPPATP